MGTNVLQPIEGSTTGLSQINAGGFGVEGPGYGGNEQIGYGTNSMNIGAPTNSTGLNLENTNSNYGIEGPGGQSVGYGTIGMPGTGASINTMKPSFLPSPLSGTLEPNQSETVNQQLYA